ncbi:Hypothetical cytosolic protein [Staphylococcus epidermidis]|uniref:DUF536 domain-containing protein n=2 Tax=Staphylococcus epidermidis TaxID=1282 RepID=UPI000D1C7529|nr:DUF536 domain-containing protein [Staphylococcus epidermidis]PTE90462.1 DUF536 domain-containing protein [Staphylococcus epidermidis]PTE96775.1 DUF536 domain-containing protein [Staphylococcus epidermidis]PTF44558.1 DUF536 domain-containing protein [Staphylococcus epidermidis]SUM53592.1 Hypothetical cytosolic protein [Staphylococcus epidermidis]
MKTIKMLADELNVTKQTIVNNAKNLNISFSKENGINYINEKDSLKIINKITKKESNTKTSTSINKEIINGDIDSKVKNESENYTNKSSILKKQLIELEKQIAILKTRAKNDEKYIENLTKQLDQQNGNVNTLNKLLENQQILTLESNKKIQKLEKELEEERQLNYSYDTNNNTINKFNHQNEKSQSSETQYKDVDSEVLKNDDMQLKKMNNKNEKIRKKQSKKGFWSKFFGN